MMSLADTPRNNGQAKYQDDCFTPKKVLQRSPPHTLAGKENRGIRSGTKRKQTTALSSNTNRLRIVPAAQPKARKQKVTSGTAPTSAPSKGRPSEGHDSKFEASSGRDMSYKRHAQDACFTPQKSLRRSPPPTPSQTKEGQDAFPPSSHWELPRTPTNPTSRRMEPVISFHGDTKSSLSKDQVASAAEPTGDELPPTSHWELPHTPPTASNVQVPELAPHWELPRTPPTKMPAPSTSQSKTLGVEAAPPTSQSGIKDKVAPPTLHWELPCTPPAVSNPATLPTLHHAPTPDERKAPPTSHWELPRTPQKIAPLMSHQPLKKSYSQHPAALGHSPLRPMTLQHHPLCHSNRASPAPKSSLTITQPSPAPDLAIPSREALCEGEVKASPPINMHTDVCSLPGLQCTEEDLAFLKHANDLKQYKALQVQGEYLLKQEKVMLEEKEQLEETSLKVKKDLDSMKVKYQEIVSTVTALISDPSLLLATRDGVSHENGLESISDVNCPQQDLNHASMAQLKKMKQLDAAQLEKTDLKLKVRLAELERTKEELQHRIRQTEERDMQQRTALHSKIQSSLDMKLALEDKIKTVSAENSSTKTKVEKLQNKLAQLQLSSIPEDSISVENVSCKMTEKQRAEESLKKIIYRCEMYVKRHQMLKEMGIRTKRINSTKHF